MIPMSSKQKKLGQKSSKTPPSDVSYFPFNQSVNMNDKNFVGTVINKLKIGNSRK